MHLPSAQEIEVYVNNKNLNGLKILHLSDLHINKQTNKSELKQLINICEQLEFNFAVLTGDIIDCKTKYIKEELQILNSFSKKIYYISGNHDLFYGLENLKKELTNFVFMDNSCNTIIFNGNKIHLAGLPDRFSKFSKIKREEKKISEFLNKSSSSIFISHQPKDYKIALKSNASLFLCGHTHGGQIFPFHYLVKLVQPFLSGLHYINKTAIYVNSGLGTWGIDYRFKAPSEITILKLISKIVE